MKIQGTDKQHNLTPHSKIKTDTPCITLQKQCARVGGLPSESQVTP